MAPFSAGVQSGAEGSLQAGAARKALSGFFLSGLLFSFLGAILPVWRHHLTQDYLTVGNYFLSMNLGILASLAPGRWLGARANPAAALAAACGLACAGFLWLALLGPGLPAWWRLGGIFVIGCGTGVLNTEVFRVISPFYRHDPAGTVNLAGTFFGLGSVLMAILVAGTFYVYTVPSILIFIALIPGFFIGIFARSRFPAEVRTGEPSLGQAFRDFRSPGAVLFTLLLFFQFGNEWSVAGWLPLFLTARLGINPESALLMLTVYWLALLVGRIAVLAMLPSVSHTRLLVGSLAAALFGCTVLLATNNRFGAVTGILLVGAGFASVYPLVVEKIGGRFPYYHPGFFNGIFSFALTGGLLAPWSLGFFTDRWGIGAVMLVPLLGTLMVFVLLLLIWAEARLGA